MRVSTYKRHQQAKRDAAEHYKSVILAKLMTAGIRPEDIPLTQIRIQHILQDFHAVAIGHTITLSAGRRSTRDGI